MNIAHQLGKTFSSARLGVKTLDMKAGGWDVGQAHEDRMIHPAIFFYVKDHQTQWTWMCTVPKACFYEAAKALPDYDVGLAVTGVAHIIHRVARGKVFEEWEEQLAKLLSAYILKTRTYAMSDQGRLAAHFLVMHYGQSGMVRPGALQGSDQHVIPAQTIMSRFDDMLAHDRQRNPEWVRD